MAETHILQAVVALALAIWWTKSWLMDPVEQRWRFIVSALAGAILWVYVSFASTRAVEPSAGAEIVFESMALAYFGAFMALVSVVGMVLGLLLWTEEEGEHAAAQLPEGIDTQFGD